MHPRLLTLISLVLGVVAGLSQTSAAQAEALLQTGRIVHLPDPITAAVLIVGTVVLIRAALAGRGR